MCEKRGYPSKHAAREASRHMRNTFRVYMCDECKGQWHVTKLRSDRRAHWK